MSESPEVWTRLDPSRSGDLELLQQILVRDQMAEWSRDPLIMARAEGVSYWDIAGRRYLDGLSGIYTVSVGHANARVLAAISQQYERLSFSPPMHGTNPLAIELANRLARLAPGDLNTVKFASSGSEANEAAIKLARQYHRLRGQPGRTKVISRYQSWHGSTGLALAASGLKSRKVVNEPLAEGFLHVFPPTCYRCPFGKQYPTCELTCAELIGDVIAQEGPETVAALLVEPIGHTGGVIDPPDEYLPRLRAICDRLGVLLIFDEIITGVGRTGQMFAADTFGVVPDIMTLGKGLAGGYFPLSAMICRKPIAEVFWGPANVNPGFVEGHTFEGHPVACAAAMAVLDEIVERDLCGNSRRQGQRLRAGLERLAAELPVIGEVRGKGLFQAVEFVADRATRARFEDSIGLGVRVGRRALAEGLLCRFDPHWIAFGPPLVSTDADIDELLNLFERSLRAVLDELGCSSANGSAPSEASTRLPA